MSTETVEDKSGLGSFSDENMFDSEAFINSQEEEEKFDLEDFDGVVVDKNEPESDPIVNQDLEEEDEEEESDDFAFDELENKDDDSGEIDIDIFNKQFNTKFTKQEELKAFIEQKEEKVEVDTDDKILDNANNYIDLVAPLLETDKAGRFVVSDENLMRKQLETLAVADGKDVNSDDVQIDINEQISELIDSGTLKYEAKDLRRSISDNVKGLNSKKSEITQKREQAKEIEAKEYKKTLQKEFINLHGTEKFYGMENIDKKIVAEAYRKASSGEFIESLKDKKVLAELSLIAELKEDIFKKASGLTYNDGMKAVLDEFKSKSKDNTIAKAQKRGTTANSKDAQLGLIDSILYTKPKEEAKAD